MPGTPTLRLAAPLFAAGPALVARQEAVAVHVQPRKPHLHPGRCFSAGEHAVAAGPRRPFGTRPPGTTLRTHQGPPGLHLCLGQPTVAIRVETGEVRREALGRLGLAETAIPVRVTPGESRGSTFSALADTLAGPLRASDGAPCLALFPRKPAVTINIEPREALVVPRLHLGKRDAAVAVLIHPTG